MHSFLFLFYFIYLSHTIHAYYARIAMISSKKTNTLAGFELEFPYSEAFWYIAARKIWQPCLQEDFSWLCRRTFCIDVNNNILSISLWKTTTLYPGRISSHDSYTYSQAETIPRRQFTFVSFLKFTEVAQIFGASIDAVNICITLTKMGWATFWTIFSQTHLVTLVRT
jgi:hypothetical protein